MWPPSRTGIGIRLSSPRFRLIIAIRLKSGIQPACAAVPDRSAIATGPISCFTDVSCVNSPPSVWKIIVVHSQFFWTLSLTASSGPGSTVRVSN